MPYCDECMYFLHADIDGNLTRICSQGFIQNESNGIRMSADAECFVPYVEQSTYREERNIPIIRKKVKKKKTKKKPYKSQDGFELVPLRRGFIEIIPLWEILNDVIRHFKADVFICGGYARWCASPKYEPAKVGDIDIYSETKKGYDRLFGRLIHDNNLKIKNENEMAITFEHPNSGVFHYMPPIQLIKPIKDGSIVAKGNKKTILSNFDFTVIRAAIESPDSVMVDKDFIHDETHNILRLKNIHCPVSSLLRCLKYVKKGYWLRPMETAKLFADWMNRDEVYRSKILDYIAKADAGEGLTEEEINELERLMRID